MTTLPQNNYNTVGVHLESFPIDIILNTSEEKIVDLDNNGYDDLAIRLNSASADGANLTFRAIAEEIDPEPTTSDSPGFGAGIAFLAMVVAVGIVIVGGRHRRN